MPNTPNFNLRYPVSTDTVDVPRDIEHLAEDLDGILRIPHVTTPGNLGATQTLSFTGIDEHNLSGILNSNLLVTFTNLHSAARFRIMVTQDSTGGRVLTLTDGTSTFTPVLDLSPSATTIVKGFYDGTDVYIEEDAGLGFDFTVVQARSEKDQA